MKNFLIRQKDHLECMKIISHIEKIYQGEMTHLNHTFYRSGKLYKKYSHLFYHAYYRDDKKALKHNLHLFAHASILVCLCLSKKGFFESEREVLDFFSEHTSSMKIPDYIIHAFNNANSENALRLAVVKSDQGNSQEVDYYLQRVQDYLYIHLDMEQAEKLGELALLHYMRDDYSKALVYLEMQYVKFDKEKIIKTEIQNNQALFERSPKARSYQLFIERFIASR